MMAHDSIALKEFQPDLPEVPHEVDEDEDSAIKLIKMVKGPNEPLVSVSSIYVVTSETPSSVVILCHRVLLYI